MKELVIYKVQNTNISVNIDTKHNTVWLNRQQLTELFRRGIKTNLDMILSVGFRVKSLLCDVVLFSQRLSMTAEFCKDFDKWNNVKKSLHKNNAIPEFNEREIWWCNIGINVGYEQDGKGDVFSRPVLIVVKINKDMFFGVPLTSQEKEGYWYLKLGEITDGVVSTAVLSQVRVFSANRLYGRIGRVGQKKLMMVRRKLEKRLIKIFSPTSRGVAPNGDLYHNYSKPKAKSQVKRSRK